MFFRKFYGVAFLLVVLALLASCQSNSALGSTPPSDEHFAPENQTITEWTSTRLSDDALQALCEDWETTLPEIEQSGEVWVRRVGGLSRVAYLGTSKILVALYDRDGEKTFSWIYAISPESATFEQISVGQNLDEVIEIDPDGSYLFLESGVGEPRESYHYTADGYLITISYDAENRITAIDRERI